MGNAILMGWRCPAENVDAYRAKGGSPNETIGRKCLCNALLANIGLGTQRADNYKEPPRVTCGDAICHLVDYLPLPTAQSYSASDVVHLLLSNPAPTCSCLEETAKSPTVAT